MNDAPEDTRRVTQPTIAFHHQATVAIGPSDLARELFRQCASPTSTASSASSTFRRPFAPAAPWGAPPVASSRQGTTRTLLVCVACLFLGVGAGHLVREGRAYAAGVPALGLGAQASTAIAPVAREVHAASTVGATTLGAPRAKELVASKPVGPRGVAHGPPRRSQPRPVAPKPPPISMDALFVDFEPAFRVAQ